MKVSLVITVLNEESTLDWLFEAVAQQTLPPTEIILVDGGSSDGTIKKIRQWQKNPVIGKKIRFLQKKGNRSTGRNFGIQQTKHPWLAITDAGCVPFPDWLANLSATQQSTQAKVIAGYYQGLPRTRFEEAVVTYALVMPNRVKPKQFLPATRSMLIHKSIWQQVGQFDEKLNYNEDFALAKKIEAANLPIAFSPNAIVGWLPRANLRSFWQMIFRFALGDIQAGIIRPKVLLIFARYILFLALLTWVWSTGTLPQNQDFFETLIFLYIVWSVWKNKRYTPHGWFYLPILQVTSDLAVMAGSLASGYSLISRTKSST